jgi:sterol desaturase/sphingolipid hydroxylase (fatty acid hydroxylase superfamily)
LFAYEGAVYAWHRTMHGSDLLFRVFHQLHHSAERHDVWGAFWFSLLDMTGWILLSSLALTLVVGVSAQAATLVLYTTTFLAVFQHANVRTPRWLGYLVQRPESHSLHHGRGVHRYNYCDLPVFDLVFGSFRNPPAFVAQQGFWDGASSRVLAMLALRDVTTPAGDSPTAAADPADLEAAERA